MMTPNVRLKMAMTAAGFDTPTEVAKRFRDINQNTIISHLNGNRAVSKKAAEKYARLFHCTAGWILYGEGAPPGELPAGSELWKDRIKQATANAVNSGVDPKEVVDALLDVINTIRSIAERQPERIPLAKEVVQRAREQSRNQKSSGTKGTGEPH